MTHRREQDILRACLDYLALRGIYAYRSNTGMARYTGRDGRPRIVRYGRLGLPDITGVLPPAGTALYVECKRPGETSTAIQRARQEELRRAGAIVLEVQRVQDLVDGLAQVRRPLNETTRPGSLEIVIRG